MLVSSIQEDWAPTAEYKEQIESEKRVKADKARKEKGEKEEKERKGKIEDYLANLSDIDRRTLEEKARERALQDGSNFLKDTEIASHIMRSYIYVLARERVGVNA